MGLLPEDKNTRQSMNDVIRVVFWFVCTLCSGFFGMTWWLTALLACNMGTSLGILRRNISANKYQDQIDAQDAIIEQLLRQNNVIMIEGTDNTTGKN